MTHRFSAIQYAMVGNEDVLRNDGWTQRIWSFVNTVWQVFSRCLTHIHHQCITGGEEIPTGETEEIRRGGTIPSNNGDVETGTIGVDQELQHNDDETTSLEGGPKKSLFKKMKQRIDDIRSPSPSPSTSSGRRPSVTSQTSNASASSLQKKGLFSKVMSKGVSAGKALQETIQNLNERGDRLSNAEDATENLANSSRNYADTSSQLLNMYRNRN